MLEVAYIASLVDVLRLGDVLVKLLDLLVVKAAKYGGVHTVNLVLMIKETIYCIVKHEKGKSFLEEARLHIGKQTKRR